MIALEKRSLGWGVNTELLANSVTSDQEKNGKEGKGESGRGGKVKQDKCGGERVDDIGKAGKGR
jgi:hypothetical protein